jgi:hypothetical protein
VVKAGTALAAVVALAAIAPGTAAADQRYASPGGTVADECTQPDPCNFKKAVEDAVDGDEVIVEPGVYDESVQVSLTKATVVHGVEGQPPPRIDSTAPTAIFVSHPQAVLRWLDIRHDGVDDALLLDDGLGERLTVRSTSPVFTCHVLGATLRDSICWARGPGGDAAGMFANSTADNTSLYNVTAFASGAGSRGVRVEALNGFAGLHGLNVIAKGSIDTEVVSAEATSVAVANFDYSNYATQSLVGPESFASAPGLSNNQTAPPQFVDAAAGNFEEDPSSPTIDRGTLELDAEQTDVDGDARVQGFGIDIGAQEFFVGPLPPDTNPPDTRILKLPKARTKRRRSKFKFGTTEPAGAVFMCSLDGRAFSRCASPKKFRVKRGKRHSFAVYSIDAAGNADPTPDAYSWKVERK